ncbi:MAG: hypothetical protein AB8B74_01445 [Crocinitomicaceae bacterium]
MRIYLTLLYSILSCYSWSQSGHNGESSFAKKLEVGTSLTYIYNTENSIPGFYRYDELSWNVNAKISLSEKLYFGVQAIPVFTKRRSGWTKTQTNYYFVGLLAMYKILDLKDLSFHIETSFNQSNMMHSQISDPYKKDNIYYLGYGFGGDILINKKKKQNLFLELGFYNYSNLVKLDNKDNYTQYVLGINYHFGKTKN